MPESFDIEQFRGRAEWQFGDVAGEARLEVAPDTAWWVRREYDERRNRVDDGVFITQYASLPLLARWILRQDGRAVPLEPSGAAPARRRGRPKAARWAHEGTSAGPPRPSSLRSSLAGGAPSGQAGPVAPERFGVLQSLLAYLLAACGEETGAPLSRRASSSSASRSRPRRSRSTSRCSTS
jgi:hypothetical protein